MGLQPVLSTRFAFAYPLLEARRRVEVDAFELRGPFLQQVGLFVGVVERFLKKASGHFEPGLVKHEALLEQVDTRMRETGDTRGGSQVVGQRQPKKIQLGDIEGAIEWQSRKRESVEEPGPPLGRSHLLVLFDRGDWRALAELSSSAANRARMADEYCGCSPDPGYLNLVEDVASEEGARRVYFLADSDVEPGRVGRRLQAPSTWPGRIRIAR